MDQTINAPAAESRMPPSYKHAAMRNVTPVDIATGLVGLGFDLPDGTVQRLAVPVKDLIWLMADVLEAYGLRRTQRSKSAGTPNLTGSCPPGTENV